MNALEEGVARHKQLEKIYAGSEQPKTETLLEQLHVLDAYLVERADRRGAHENGAVAYENSARLLRNILKNQKEPEIEWGVQYLDENENYQYWWGLTSDPRLPRVVNGATFSALIDENGCISIDDEFVEVTAVSKRTKPIQLSSWESIEELTKDTPR